MQYVLTDGMTYSEIGYVIHYYVNTLHKKIELLYGLSFVGRVRADAFQAFKHEQQSLDVKSQAALVAAEAILNTEKPVFNITYIDKKPAQRKATQLSYDNIELKEDNDGDNQD